MIESLALIQLNIALTFKEQITISLSLSTFMRWFILGYLKAIKVSISIQGEILVLLTVPGGMVIGHKGTLNYYITENFF